MKNSGNCQWTFSNFDNAFSRMCILAIKPNASKFIRKGAFYKKTFYENFDTREQWIVFVRFLNLYYLI